MPQPATHHWDAHSTGYRKRVGHSADKVAEQNWKLHWHCYSADSSNTAWMDSPEACSPLAEALQNVPQPAETAGMTTLQPMTTSTEMKQK